MNGQKNLADLQPNKYFFTLAVLLGSMFAFVVPDDDLKNGWLLHALHWQIQTVVPMLIAIIAHRLLSNSTLIKKLSPWLKLLLSGTVASLLFTPIALFSDTFFAYEKLTNPYIIELFDEFLAIAPPIIVFWVAINIPFFYGWRLHKEDLQNDGHDKNEVKNKHQANFYKLIPEEIHGELLFLKSELHYLQVVTNKGKALILYSLKNAISEVQEKDGFQPHRSFWVHRPYITSLEKNGREGRITMSDGTTIPVSRTNMKMLTN